MKWSTHWAIGTRVVETWLRRRLRLSPRPYQWLLELTLECNSRCSSCSIWKTSAAVKRRQMTLSEVEKIFAVNGRDLTWLALSGGEVTCYEEFPAVVAAAKRYCSNLRLVTFTTNGLLPAKAFEYARAIRAAGFDCFITISLDGDAKAHDSIRGVPGNHALAWETYHLLRADGLNVHFGITLSGSNVEFVERGYSQLNTQIKAVTIQHEHGIYGSANAVDDTAIERSLDVICSAYRVRGVGDLLERWYVELSREFVRQGRRSNVVACAVGRAAVHIRPDGTTLACMFMPPFGNVREGANLRAMLNAPPSLRILAQVDAGECPHCWMNCYAPHSILYDPARALLRCWRGLLQGGRLVISRNRDWGVS
jgi:MoaA/NifB/PqqE/SkfB family radical SAM enzyme